MARARTSVWAGITLAGALVLASCGGDDGGGASPDGSTTTSVALGATVAPGTTVAEEAAMPTDFDPNGELVFGYSAAGVNLDPHKGLGADHTYIYPLYDRLLKLGDDFQMKPMAATSWEFADDGSYLEFKLRDDIMFHDGTKLDATAVKLSLERGKNLPASAVAAALAPITSIQVVDPTTVRLMLSGGGAQLPSTLGTVAGSIISPKALANPNLDLTQGPGDAGSGPYKVVEFKPSDRTVYEQAQAPGEYWDPTAGLLKRFTWLYVANGAQRINGVRADDLDLAQITTTDVPAAADVAKQTGFGGRRATLALTQHQFFMRATNAPLDNLKLRQAINYAFDKSSIGDGLYGGSCTPATQFYPESHWAHDPRIDSLYSYDVAKAKDLIKQSGVTDLTFGQAFSPLYETPAPAAQAMLKAVGITTELQPLPYADLVTQWFAGSVDSMYGGVVGSVDPAQYLFDIYLSGQKLIPEADRAEFVTMAEKANDPTLSQDERGAIYKDIFYKIAQNGYTVPVCNSQQFWLEHGQVGGLDRLMFTFIGLVDPRYLYAIKA